MPTIRELPMDLRPRDRLAYAGPSALSSAELLSLILGSGGRSQNAIHLAEELLTSTGGLPGLSRQRLAELERIPNIGPAKAAIIQAALELGKRLVTAVPPDRFQIRSPADLANLLMLEMSLLDTEQLRVVMLDTRNQVIGQHIAYSGNVNSAIVRIAEVLREPIRALATGFALAHNHPSGDPTPSPEDVRLTEMIFESAKQMDIALIDHIIIGKGRYVSLKERGLGIH
jgi:DNA repair protein RadC